jgi:hypothetical protein
MSKTRRKPASDIRPARRSLVELTAAASRAIDDGLRLTSAGLIAASAYDPPRSAPAANTEEGTTPAPQVTASAPVGKPEALNEATARRARCANPGSTAEMVVNIAKDYHKNAFESINLAVGAALDHAKDFAEKRVGSDGALKGGRGVETNFAAGLNGTAAEFHSEALEMMKANVNTILEYARELARTTTAADFVQLTGTQARKQCELILKQAGSLRSLTQTKSKSSTD